MASRINPKILMVSIVFCIACYGCKKSSVHSITPAPVPAITFADSSTLGFNWTGYRIVGDTLTFHSNASSVTTYSWDFGDGSTSGGATPGHVYAAEGTYTVRLVLNGDSAYRASKTVKISTDPVYTSSMGGVRLWHHYLVLGAPFDSTIHYPDTSFAVNIIDPLTVSVLGDTLNYSNTAGSLCFFKGLQVLYFTPSSNSIIFNLSNGQLSWPSNEYYQTP